jgi:uncharacterized DUF497 family protein
VFEWDDQKADLNYRKHGVSFEEAATAFGDSDGLHGDDVGHSQDEPRFRRIGKSISAESARDLHGEEDGK